MHARSDTDLLAVQQAPAPIARRKADAIAARRQWWARAAERVHLEFRPAGWLLITLGILRLWLKRPRLGKRTVFGLAWAFVPPKLKLAAGGVAAGALILLAGAIAALVLVLNQLA